jgi:excisionase family DNA binding protein
MPNDEPRFYTPQEAARLLGVHVQTVLRSIDSGQLPALVIGGPKRHTYRIPADALATWPSPLITDHPATAPTGPLPTEEVRPDVEVLDAVAYLAGPYRDPRGAYWVRENIRTAERVALQLWQHGLPTLCPHLNTALWDGAGPDDLWLHGDLIMLSRCDLVILGPGWQHSPGAQAERAKADQIGIPVLEWAGGLNLGAILALAGRISMARQSEREHPAP